LSQLFSRSISDEKHVEANLTFAIISHNMAIKNLPDVFSLQQLADLERGAGKVIRETDNMGVSWWCKPGSFAATAVGIFTMRAVLRGIG
jgi:hypothetical protein